MFQCCLTSKVMFCHCSPQFNVCTLHCTAHSSCQWRPITRWCWGPALCQIEVSGVWTLQNDDQFMHTKNMGILWVSQSTTHPISWILCTENLGCCWEQAGWAFIIQPLVAIKLTVLSCNLLLHWQHILRLPTSSNNLLLFQS